MPHVEWEQIRGHEHAPVMTTARIRIHTLDTLRLSKKLRSPNAVFMIDLENVKLSECRTSMLRVHGSEVTAEFVVGKFEPKITGQHSCLPETDLPETEDAKRSFVTDFLKALYEIK
jgi:hypothetical protein